ncbi:MAG: hypothetical protein C3F17_03560 [Bradyrhizobiaceae bacterium]|nr:MAG: hypothetical protein C3F17_03560 [Bradyrhizobiaceae bacterium]
MTRFDLFTIGHSNHAIDDFLARLTGAGVDAVADVRSVPFSRRYPWFSQGPLGDRLAREGLAYVGLGDALGGRPVDPALFADGVVDFEAIAATPQFRAGLARVVDGTKRFRICLLCAEREPLDCHRCLLVGRALAGGGLAIGHILADRTVEPHAETEERLLRLAGEADDLFADRAARLGRAYRRRARAKAYRAPP